jgi:hypothetical protein
LHIISKAKGIIISQQNLASSGCQANVTSSSQIVGEEKRRDALVPPNPNELDRAARIGIFFAWSNGA